MSQAKRIIFCTYPSLYSDLVLDELLQAHQLQALNLVAVVFSTRVLSPHYSAWRASMRQIQLSGLRYAAYLWAVTGLYQGLRRLRRRPSFSQRLKALGISCHDTKDINSLKSISFLRQYSADVYLSAHFNQLIKAEVLQLPHLACVNIHPSLLPNLQGVDPAFYALLRRCLETGVTVHVQNAQFDQGPVLVQTPLRLRWHDSLLSLNVKLFKLGAMAAVECIRQLTLEQLASAQSAQGIGRYDSWPSPADAKHFRQQYRYLRWREYGAFIKR